MSGINFRSAPTHARRSRSHSVLPPAQDLLTRTVGFVWHPMSFARRQLQILKDGGPVQLRQLANGRMLYVHPSPDAFTLASSV
ncbi:MAG: hypothetical protein EBV49_13375 [Betaproteobacteria bacterium]|nr:hypothetical protein [Betaproteobacteria bacterium]NCV15468.1 hypothetical protein [Betaproteobacteria bacterium]